MIATCLDTRSVLLKKYPQAEAHIDALLAAADDKEEVKVLYGVDATKLGGKEVKKGGFDRIVFNFPHVGGLTKDVNRQVRYNQGRHLYLTAQMGWGILTKSYVTRRIAGWLFQICNSYTYARRDDCRHRIRG